MIKRWNCFSWGFFDMSGKFSSFCSPFVFLFSHSVGYTPRLLRSSFSMIALFFFFFLLAFWPFASSPLGFLPKHVSPSEYHISYVSLENFSSSDLTISMSVGATLYNRLQCRFALNVCCGNFHVVSPCEDERRKAKRRGCLVFDFFHA